MKTNVKEEKEREKRSLTQKEIRGVADFFVEINVLKRTPRVGWRLSGPPIGKEPDYDAGHIGIVAQIAYVLSRLEGLDKKKALLAAIMALFHENNETRIGDNDKLTAYYLTVPKTVFERALLDQTSRLPSPLGEEIRKFAREANYSDSPEATIVQDADALEASVQAVMNSIRGLLPETELLNRYLDPERFKTATARKLIRFYRNQNNRKNLSIHWWMSQLNLV